MKTFIGLSIFISITISYLGAFGQVTITGPTCVIQGTIYEYTIAGNWDSVSTMKLCVTGGEIADTIHNNTCTATEPPIARALIQWNKTGPVSINVTSTAGNGILNITVTQQLIPGKLDTASAFQMIGYDSIPALIVCSQDTGGACNPQYRDQWQQSTDEMIWNDIAGATDQNLSITNGLHQTTYFRRKVTEMNSGTIGYSDVAVIDVTPPPTGLFFKLNKMKIGNTYASTGLVRKFNLKTL